MFSSRYVIIFKSQGYQFLKKIKNIKINKFLTRYNKQGRIEEEKITGK